MKDRPVLEKRELDVAGWKLCQITQDTWRLETVRTVSRLHKIIRSIRNAAMSVSARINLYLKETMN